MREEIINPVLNLEIVDVIGIKDLHPDLDPGKENQTQ
jgi:hypothetical protein